MASSSISQQLAQSTERSDFTTVQTEVADSSYLVWLSSTVFLFIILVAFLAYGRWWLEKIKKELQFEQYKTQDLKKKLKLALITIRKMEMNPDLVYAREFNLDYLRLRMDEEIFHDVVLNQVKMKVSQLISEVLRPGAHQSAVGIVGHARQIDSSFDITYETENSNGKWTKAVLFRIQIKLNKLPTQASSTTVSQICECLKNFLSPSIQPNNWQPVIQGKIVLLNWDQKAKPTPLLILEQLDEGISTVTWSQKAFQFSQ